jgi:hypothetical protein
VSATGSALAREARWPGEVRIAATCWSCGDFQYKSVRGHHPTRGYFAWYCGSCEVTWSGPGAEVSPAA